jgi:hypothetical protein
LGGLFHVASSKRATWSKPMAEQAKRIALPNSDNDDGTPQHWRANPALAPAETVDEFCQLEGISKRTWHYLVARGEAPEIYYVRSLPRISQEAHRKWREQQAAKPAPTVRRGRPRKLAGASS